MLLKLIRLLNVSELEQIELSLDFCGCYILCVFENRITENGHDGGDKLNSFQSYNALSNASMFLKPMIMFKDHWDVFLGILKTFISRSLMLFKFRSFRS